MIKFINTTLNSKKIIYKCLFFINYPIITSFKFVFCGEFRF